MKQAYALYYITIFNSAPHSGKNSIIVGIQRYPEEPLNIPVKGMEGKILTAIFELNGQRFMALDGGSIFKFTEATSF